MKRILILPLILFGLIQTAQAGDFQPYVGAGFGMASLNFEETGTGLSDHGSTFAGYGSIGFDYGEYLGAELRIGATGTASVTVGGLNYDLSSDWLLSYLAKFQLPVSEQFKIYAMAGATTTKQTTTITTPGWIFIATGTPRFSETTTNGSFGAGIDFQVNDQWYIGTEIMAYGAGLATLTGNLKYSF